MGPHCNFIFYLSVFCSSACFSSDHTQNPAVWSKWSQWSKCSASCDYGIQTRSRICIQSLSTRCPGASEEQKSCHDAICPSYVNWPRIHFSGEFVANTPTANNIRCYFNNDEFCPVCNTYREGDTTEVFKNIMRMHSTKWTLTTERPIFVLIYLLLRLLQNESYVVDLFSRKSAHVKGTSAPYFVHKYPSGSPMGNGHFYFVRAQIRSACWDASSTCSTKDPIVNHTFKGIAHGRIVDLDPDWQEASEIIGFHVRVDGVLEGKMIRTAMTHGTIRYQGIGDRAMAPTFKSKLINIQWIDDVFKTKFNNATKLSIAFVLDNFNYETLSGRLTGTIGMTSRDDPLTTFGARVMRPFYPDKDSKWEIPFHISHNHKKIVMDLANVIDTDAHGNFTVSTLKHVDLVILSNGWNCPGSSHECFTRTLICNEHKLFLLTQGGAVDEVHENLSWYTVFGGLKEVSLSWITDDNIDLISRSRIGLVNRSSLQGEYVTKTKKVAYKLCDLFPKHCLVAMNSSEDFCNLIALEQVHGINFKPMKHWTTRLSRGETWSVPVLTTSFGRPLKGVKVRLESIKRSNSHDACSKKNPCDIFIGRPKNALLFSSPATTDKNGLASLSVKVVRNIGFPRKCGLDGQIYPLALLMKYIDRNGNVVSMGDGGMFDFARDLMYSEALKQCNLDAVYCTFTFAVKVFSSLPASVMRKTCPSWVEDIRPIFQFYRNMFPVMAKRDIINLRSIENVRSKLHLINMSMFEFPWDHRNFMPTTRDLSPDKTEIVRRWIECEVHGYKTRKSKNITSSANKMDEDRENVCGTSENLMRSLSELRKHLQTAMLLELYTIPPYLTALFSLKRNRLKKAASILKTITAEEMLHMSLDSNVLNSVGGSPRLSEAQWIPSYPTPFPSRDFYEIRPDIILTLEPYSRQLAKEVFSEIEKPPPTEVLETLRDIAILWHRLPNDQGGNWRFDNRSGMFHDRYGSTKRNGNGPLWYYRTMEKKPLTVIKGLEMNDTWNSIFRFSSDELKKLHIKDVYSIGGFYAHVMLRLLQIESCVKTNTTANNTIFTGNPKRQLGHKQFYATKGRTSSVLFPVRGLKSAIEALFEVTYQGEGATPCVPFITSVAENFSISTSFETNKKDPFFSEISPFDDTSHYIKFQELGHGRRLQAFRERPPNWSKLSCLPKPSRLCGCSDSNNDSWCFTHCFSGESLDFDEDNSVWPIVSIPFEMGGFPHPNKINPKADHAMIQFDHTYTNMLHCLEKAMNGKPEHMTTCTATMYELVDLGKMLVKIPLHEGGDPNIGPNAGPQWRYVLDPYSREGILGYKSSYVKPVFC